MSTDLDQLLEFVRFTHRIRSVRRAIIFEDNVHENDMEHQYQLALAAWFLIENDKLLLDKFRCVAMALVHDMVEVYAGDVIAFASKKELQAKAKNEEAALKQLRKDWPKFSSLHEILEEYEARKTPESKFVYSLDKLLPIINNYLYEGKIWKKLHINLEQVKVVKEGKIDKNNQINEYYKSLLKILEHRPELFGGKIGQ